MKLGDSIKIKKDEYIVEIESFCYLHAAGTGYKFNLSVDYNNNPDNIKLEKLIFTKEQFNELIKNEKLDYGLVNSMHLIDNQYILNKISVSNT